MTTPSPAPDATGRRFSIGQALAQLRGEFPDATVSKLRFLEAAGLVAPARARSGYRKFSAADVDRLRYVLRVQRDHFLPLRVIRDHLDAIDRGLRPPDIPEHTPRAPDDTAEPGVGATAEPDPGAERERQLRLSRAELVRDAGIDDELAGELVAYGLLSPVDEAEHFDGRALRLARVAGELAGFGLRPRHLRPVVTAAERELALVEQSVAPLARSRDPAAAEHARSAAQELLGLLVRLHELVLALHYDSVPAAAQRPGS